MLGGTRRLYHGTAPDFFGHTVAPGPIRPNDYRPARRRSPMIFTRTECNTTATPRCPPTLVGTGVHMGLPCPLTGTDVSATVCGFIAEVRVEQTYVNPHDR